MGLTVRSDKQNAEIYLKKDGGDVDIHIVTPDGKDIDVAYFDQNGKFHTLLLGDKDIESLKGVVETAEDQLKVN